MNMLLYLGHSIVLLFNQQGHFIVLYENILFTDQWRQHLANDQSYFKGKYFILCHAYTSCIKFFCS